MQQKDDSEVDADKIKQFAASFRKQLSTTLNKRISRKVSLINRRLDSLARLLETNQICVAIRYSAEDQSLIISSNAIHQTSRQTNQYIDNISNIMSLLANHDASMSHIVEQLSKFITINFIQEKRFGLGGETKNSIQQKIKYQLEELFKSGQKTKDWERDTIPDDTLEEQLVKHTSRLARDFIKLRKSIHNVSHASGEEAVILKAMRDNKTALIKTGLKDEHAEIRQIYSIGQDSPQKPYIGISKLCCARCALTIKVMDVPTRGNHGRVFNNWGMPGFFKNDPASFFKFLGPASIHYAVLTPKEKAVADELIADGKQLFQGKESKSCMMPDTSSSDEAFGLSDESVDPDELDFNDVFRTMHLKDQDPQAYTGLRNSGTPIKQILAYSQTPKKLALLSSYAAIRLVDCGECDYEDLESLYDEDPTLLEYVLADRSNLIDDEGFDAAVDRYRKALQTSYDYDDDEACYEFDVDEAARQANIDENGWDYQENDEDSENRYGYGSDF